MEGKQCLAVNGERSGSGTFMDKPPMRVPTQPQPLKLARRPTLFDESLKTRSHPLHARSRYLGNDVNIAQSASFRGAILVHADPGCAPLRAPARRTR
eukprot:3192645-Alexandrium_andersonii.AAC.1